MSSQEMEISFLNTYFIYKKVRHEIAPVKLSDAPRIEENEIAIDNIMNKIEDEMQEVNNNNKKNTEYENSNI